MLGHAVLAARIYLSSLVLIASAGLGAGCALDREPSQGEGQRQGIASDAGPNTGNRGIGNAGAGALAAVCPGPQCPTNSGLLPGGTCEPTGVFGLRETVDVAWGGRSTPLGYITDNGRGRILVDLKLTINQVNPNGSFTAEVTPCGINLPPFFSSVLCEVYQPVFPREMWESPRMRKLTANGRYSCNRPGCAMQLDPMTELIGIDLDNPGGFWPLATETSMVQCTAGSGAPCFLDHDGDSHPGVTIKMFTMGSNPANQVCAAGYPFRNPPLTSGTFMIASGVAPRAAELYLGTRLRIAGQGALTDSCRQRVGKGAAQGFDSRAIGCGVQAPAGQDCDSSQQMFMDLNLPIYYVLNEGQMPDPKLDLPDKSTSTGTTFAVTRLGGAHDAVSCADVHTASY